MNNPSGKIKILHIVNWLNRGGIESYLMNIIRTYDRDKFQMDFCCKGKALGEMTDEARTMGSKVFSCPMGLNLLAFIRRLVRLLRQNKYDIVNCHVAELSGPIVFAAHLAGIPVKVSSYHNIESTSAERIVKKFPFLKLFRSICLTVFHYAVLKYSTAITGCSEGALDAYFPAREVNDKRFKVIYYGIELDHFTDLNRNIAREEFPEISNESLVVGHVGRFNEPKDHATFVKAAKIISETVPNVHFLLVGDGYLKPTIEQLVRESVLEDKFTFTGIRKDVPKILSIMDCILFPSVAEGFGLVLIEAQAAGLPAVASDLPGIREALCPQMQELCVEPRDHKKFADNVIKLLRSPQKRCELGRAGRNFVEQRFSCDVATKRLTDFYEGLLRSSTHKGPWE